MNRYDIIEARKGGARVSIEKILATITVIVTAFKAVTSSLKDINDIQTDRKRLEMEKRSSQSPSKTKRTP